MKKIRLLPMLTAIICAMPAYAQRNHIPQFTPHNERTVLEDIARLEKKTDKFNLYLNMHADFLAQWRENTFQEGEFRFQQLRIEMKGDLNDWLSYRFRQRLNKGDNTDGYRDNVLQSIDVAEIGLSFKKWQIDLGKQCIAYGGIEFDRNPIEIYQYSDMGEYNTGFMTGVKVAYNFTPDQQLQVQMLNSLVGTSRQMYGDYQPSKMPMAYTVNWNGNFNNVIKTRWSATVMNETHKEYLYYFALGNEFYITPKFDGYFDWMYSIEGIDRKGLITTFLKGDDYSRRAKDVDYMSFVLHLNYRIHPSWNVFAKGMYENEGVYKTNTEENGATYDKGRYRTAWGYIGGVEYYPFKDRTLHFFAAYVGRNYKYTQRAKLLGNTDYTTNNFSLGFIWQLPIF